MEFKQFEIRDAATFIPALAVRVSRDDGYLMRRAGFGDHCVYLIKLATQQCSYDPYEWDSRTMSAAHQHIENDWDSLTSEDVIDVQYILRETPAPKRSERFDESSR